MHYPDRISFFSSHFPLLRMSLQEFFACVNIILPRAVPWSQGHPLRRAFAFGAGVPEARNQAKSCNCIAKRRVPVYIMYGNFIVFTRNAQGFPPRGFHSIKNCSLGHAQPGSLKLPKEEIPIKTPIVSYIFIGKVN